MSNEEKTLLDEFAMAALTGILSNVSVMGQWAGIDSYTDLAYKYAEQMLAVRDEINKEKSDGK